MRGIHQTLHGFRAFVRVKGHPLKSKRFPRDADLEKIKLWRERERAKLILQRQEHHAPYVGGAFRADAILYLESVKAMPTYAERVRQIFEWIGLFGDQESATITPAQIRAQRDRWLTVGPRSRQRGKERIIEAKPLAASSVNHRLRALQNMWTVLWPGTPNPVRQVPEAEEPQIVPRALSASVINAVLAKLPPGKTVARLNVLRWTGMPAKTLMRLKAADVDLKRKLVYLPGRQKGKGTHGAVLPLLPQAVKAFKMLIRENGWGEFSASGMHSLVQKACESADVPRMNPYQLRHTFATNFLLATNDLRATQRALNHSTMKLTERYAHGAVEPAMVAAYAKMAKAQRKVARKVTTTKKRP
mgnify:CR=1 FL=1